MKFFLSLSAVFFLSLSALAGKPFSNLENLKNSLGFTKYYNEDNNGRRLRIAVLDKGFAGYENEIGRTLPQDTYYYPGPNQPAPTPTATAGGTETDHGLRMAQILTAFMTNDLKASQWEPELFLYNVFGYTNFKAAIDDMIEQQVDLVLYSEVWEYGGNHDGTGFINAQVTRATNAGIIWVNAAGNFGLTTYNSKIEIGQDSWVKLPNQNQALAIRCEAGKQKKCPVKIVLSWNDFKNDVNIGTDKDLDLALTDDLLNIVQSSALKQTKEDAERPGYSKYPREIIQAELKPGNYFLRVKARSENFGSRDTLRITVDGEGVQMPSHSVDETLLNPADNTTVITVGASDSDRSSSSRRLGKPDLMAPSSIKLTEGGEYRGSSNSAAIVAAGLAILKSNEPKKTRKDLIEATRSTANQFWDRRGLSLNLLRFGPTGPGCFENARMQVPAYLQDIIMKGGVLVQTTASVRVMVPFDPIFAAPYLRRNMINDMIVAMPQGGYAVFPRFGIIPQGAAEIFQRPYEAGLCQLPAGMGSTFYLP
ncbi:S8 family serine peptidase [Bdellovibrio sp. HCB2-146]|uniref:S8 family serine peptidase n=1 Tax=Bdellovibrio sp. HCB2-146 TaxID=3394362 RepID=UPI0039BD1FBC